MDLDLNTKLAVVTGSTEGIGRAIAAGLATEGAKVIVNGRTREKVEKVAQEISATGQDYGVAADLSSADGVAELIAEARKIGPVQGSPAQEYLEEPWLHGHRLVA